MLLLGATPSAGRICVTRGFTLAPGIANWTPWTITRSVLMMPERIARSPPTKGPVSTGLAATVSSLPTTSTILRAPRRVSGSPALGAASGVPPGALAAGRTCSTR